MARIHPTAVIDPRAKLAEDVEVAPYVVIGEGVELAEGVEIGSHVNIMGKTSIGARTRVFPFAILGSDPQVRGFSGETTALAIGEDNIIREYVSIHIGTPEGGGCTRIGDDNLIMNGVHVGHDSLIGSHCIIASHCAIAGHVELQDYAVVGGLSGIHQFTRVGESAMVAAMSGVTKDAPPFSLVAGERATTRGVNSVGLRRRGFDAASRRAIRQAFHILFSSKLRLEPALARVREECEASPEIERLLHFLESSERGFSR